MQNGFAVFRHVRYSFAYVRALLESPMEGPWRTERCRGEKKHGQGGERVGGRAGEREVLEIFSISQDLPDEAVAASSCVVSLLHLLECLVHDALRIAVSSHSP